MHAVWSKVGAEVDQGADVVPTAAAQVFIGAGDVEALRADHQPVQSDERQAFGADDVAVFGALGGADFAGRLGQRKRCDLDSGITGSADCLAGVGERPLVEGLVADGMAKNHELSVYKQPPAARRGECLPQY